MRPMLALMALALWGAALAQDKAAPAAADEPKAEGPKTPAKAAEKKKEPVLEIKRTGPPECQVKPVMTDAEIETCKRAGREKHG